ncbi:MAG: hypothetical protein ACYT04_49135, partial [Nostoc sp.]
MDKKQRRLNSKKIYQLTIVKYVFYILGASLTTSFTASMGILVNPAVAEDNTIFQKQPAASLTESASIQIKKAIVSPKVDSSNLSPAQMLMISPKQGDHQILLEAQTPFTDSQTQLNDSELRQRLKIKPLLGGIGGKQIYYPSLSFGIPSAFGANWGDFFVEASGATRRDGNGNGGLDGSISAGFGLGDSQKSIG